MGQLNAGSNLIFVACQPRSGSTLLQKILGTHPEIYTTSEPWVMLPPVYSLRSKGIKATFDWELAHTGLKTFVKDLPKGRVDFIEGLRRMYEYLYNRALENSDEQIFLDKTPRYYLILSELVEIFPNARLVLLFRNPLSVLSSIVRTWIGSDWTKIRRYKNDILEAPFHLLEARRELETAVSLRYEDLVQRPEQVVESLCYDLDLSFFPSMIEYSGTDTKKWTFGDPSKVYQHNEPNTTSLRKWASTNNAQEWRLLRDYAEFLGADVFEDLGYGYDECISLLREDRPQQHKLRYTVSMDWLLQSDRQKGVRWRHYTVKFLSRLRDQGLLGGSTEIFRDLLSRIRT